MGIALCQPGLDAFAGDALGATDSLKILRFPSLPDDPTVKVRFEDEYPAAYERLAHAASRLRARVTVRDESHAERPAVSRSHEILIFDENLKVITEPLDNEPGGLNGTAFLVVPGQACIVNAPLTPAASVGEISPTPQGRLRTWIIPRCHRYLDAAFSADGYPLVPRLRNNEAVYQSGFQDSSDGSIVVTFTFMNRDEHWGEMQPSGTLQVQFDPQMDWSIRKFILTSGPPFNFVTQGSVAVERLEDHGVVATAIEWAAYDLADAPGQDSSATPAAFSERQVGTIEIMERPAAFVQQDFTLESLGVVDVEKHTARVRWIITVTANLILLLLLLGWFLRSRASSRRHATAEIQNGTAHAL